MPIIINISSILIPIFVTAFGLLAGLLFTVIFFFGEDKAWKFTLPGGVIASWLTYATIAGLIQWA